MNYYSNLIVDAGSDNNAVFRSIDRLLHRIPEKRPPSCQSTPVLVNKFVNFFKDKITKIKSQLQSNDSHLNQFSHLDSSQDCKLDSFTPTSNDELTKLASKVFSKSCCLDPLPASLLANEFSTLPPTIPFVAKSCCLKSSSKKTVFKS